MVKSNATATKTTGVDWWTMSHRSYFVATQPIIETYYGVVNDTVPHHLCMTWSVFFNLLLISGGDQFVFNLIKIGWMYPQNPWLHIGYCLLGSLAGYWVWGLRETLKRTFVLTRLTDVFQNVGLKSPMGKLPNYIFDRPLDEVTRKLRVTNAYLPLSQFRANQEKLESALQIYIDDVREDRARGTVDIIYSHHEMPRQVKFDLQDLTGKACFLVGQTRSRQVRSHLDETPHLLIGGQTGGGKSTFLRQFITSLYIKNPTFNFCLIDLKGGLEFQLFERLPRVKVCASATRAKEMLDQTSRILEYRQKILKLNNCKDIAQFLAIPEENRVTEGVDSELNKLHDRHIIVIDEAAELFMAGGLLKAPEVQEARRVAARISALGRALGVHLVVATQKPDVKAVDGQIKANLTGILSFAMPNLACSMSILSNGRAYELPPVPGRAIWKSGLEQSEIQTPFLSIEQATELLAAYRQERANHD